MFVPNRLPNWSLWEVVCLPLARNSKTLCLTPLTQFGKVHGVRKDVFFSGILLERFLEMICWEVICSGVALFGGLRGYCLVAFGEVVYRQHMFEAKRLRRGGAEILKTTNDGNGDGSHRCNV